MKIQTNIEAINAYGNQNKTLMSLQKDLEKLSSGYRINRAADDAAGLAISEKMRALIRGTSMAMHNVTDGISMIQTAEGALQEVHAMLQRMNELSVQSANATYDDEVDRAALQLEFGQLQDEIDRTGTFAHFNGMKLFSGTASTDANADVTLESLLADKSGPLKNIIYTETVFDFTTTQTTTGTSNNFSADYQAVANELQASIVPQTVQAILSKYPAFNYLTGSSIGIGLKLDTGDPSTLATVTVQTGYYSGPPVKGAFLTYTLYVNMAAITDINNAAERSALEQTIAHEMIHAFMDEAITAGMTGTTPNGISDAYEFPSWFTEGMAQTASGPGNWTWAPTGPNGGLGLTASSTTAQITTALSGNNTRLGSGQTASEYGTGYLACMYLGYLAAGSDANMDSNTAAATELASGVSKILGHLIEGYSLDDVIKSVTNEQYTNTAAFENGFATDAGALAFIQKLLQYTSDDPLDDGNIGGGLLRGDLNSTDPVADTDISGLNLFALNTSNTAVKNEYPSNITILSGGTVSGQGVSPQGTSPPVGILAPVVPTPTGPPANCGAFTIIGGTENVDYKYENGTLTILSGTALNIKNTNPAATTDKILIQDGITANVTLSGVNIDVSATGDWQTGTTGESALKVDGTSTLNLTLAAGTTNTLKSGAYRAGLEVETGATLIIGGTGSLNATSGWSGAGIGGSSGDDGGTITINSGIVTTTAIAGSWGAGIGGGSSGNGGTITINGGTVTAIANYGAGIGGGWEGDGDTVTINGGTITATSSYGGAGIGGGRSGNGGTIVISGGTVTATGGHEGAGIGGGGTVLVNDNPICGDGGNITISGGTVTATGGSSGGAGIGGGGNSHSMGFGGGDGGTITISGGTVTATGGTGAQIIGKGIDGTSSGSFSTDGSGGTAIMTLGNGTDDPEVNTDLVGDLSGIDGWYITINGIKYPKGGTTPGPTDPPGGGGTGGGTGGTGGNDPDPVPSGGSNVWILQVGASHTETMEVVIDVMNTKVLNIDRDTVNIATRDAANNAISAIQTAINTVSAQRAKLGAYQNRLEHTYNNLAATEENITAAESIIRDTDMAGQMMRYTKNNILMQSAQAMLAQANNLPQSVLSLLQ